MYDLRHTVFCFLVVYIINIAAKNAGDDLNLARVFRTPKDFSRVNFDHFEILERNNFDAPAESQQEQVAANEEPATLLQPKSVANAQVMLRFGGDDIQGKNCIENPSKERPCPNHDHQYPANNEIRYLPPYSPCYCHPAHQSVPYLPPPLPPYGYPYPPYAFPGPYYPRPEFGRGPYGLYHGQLIPSEDSCSCSQEKRAFLGRKDVPGNIRTENIPVTIDLTEDVIPKCQKCLENPRNPVTGDNPLHQNQPNEEANQSGDRSLRFLHFIKNFGKTSPSPDGKITPQTQQETKKDNENPKKTILVEEPQFVTKEDVTEPEVSIASNPDGNQNSTESKLPQSTIPITEANIIMPEKINQQKYPSESYDPNGTGPAKHPDFVTEDKVTGPRHSSQNYPIYQIIPSDGYNPNQFRPQRFPDFITKEDVMEPTVNHPNYPYEGCNSHAPKPERFPYFNNEGNVIRPGYPTVKYPKYPSGGFDLNQSRPGRFPDFITKEDFMEPKYPTSNFPHQLSGGTHPNTPRPGSFPDFIRKEDLLKTEYLTGNHPNYLSGENSPNKPRPGRFPDFITKEDVMESGYPTANYPMHASSGFNPDQARPGRFPDYNKKGNYPVYSNHPSASNYPDETRPWKFTDSTTKDGIGGLKWPGSNECPHPNQPCGGRADELPELVTPEDVKEPEYPVRECTHHHEHPCKGYKPDEPRPWKFSDFVIKGNATNPTRPTGNCHHHNNHCGGDFPTTIKPEGIEPEYPEGECSHHHKHPCEGYKPAEPRPWKFSDFVIKDNASNPARPTGNCHHHNNHCGGNFPTTIKPEVNEPEYPEGECSHHQEHQCASYKPDEPRTWKFSDFIIKDNATGQIRPTKNCHHHNHHCGRNDPTTIKPGVIEPEYPEGQYHEHPCGKYEQDGSRPVTFPEYENPTGTKLEESPDFITKEDVIEPKYLTGKNPDYQNLPIEGMNPDRTRPDNVSDFISEVDLREPDHHYQTKQEEDRSGNSPDFITKEDVLEPKNPIGDYPDQQNVIKSGQVPDPINKEDAKEFEYTTDNSKWNTNGTKSEKFPDFITKEDVKESPIVVEDIPTKPSVEEDSTTAGKEEKPLCEDDSENLEPSVMKELDCTSAIDMAQPIFFFPVDPAQPILLPAVHKPTISKKHMKPVVICVKHPVSSLCECNNVHAPKKSEIESWLNKSLVPYNCQICGHKHKLLVTYPLTCDYTPHRCIEDINDTGCQCFRNKGFCDCCNCHRNPNIPFGKRFPSDMDSLQRIVAPAYQSAGYSTSSGSSMSTSVSQVGNQRPKVYIDGYHTSEGSGYYSDPYKNVYYQQPKVLDVVRTPSPYLPVVEHSRVEQPEWYSVVPKYDIVPRKITPLDVPDLLPTDVFICKQCNNPHDRRIVCHREYVPREARTDQRVPPRADRVGEIVEGEPLVRFSPPQNNYYRSPAVAA